MNRTAPGVIEYSRRRSCVVEQLAGTVDAMVVTLAANVRYLTGFTGSNGWLVLGAEDALLLTDTRYTEQAAAETHGLPLEIAPAGLAAGLPPRLGDRALRRVGFEAGNVTVALRGKLEEALEAEWVPLEGIVEGLRRCKDEEEIAAVRAALDLTEEALGEVAATIRPGQSEAEVAAALEYACRRRGATAMAFETIVASGPRSALPHGVASERVIRAGEPVMIDMGCVLRGYRSDITRMLWVGGEPDDEWRVAHALVDAARAAGLAALRAGVDCAAVDAAARSLIESAGHGDAFSHGTGHGVGLEIHEAPKLSARSIDVLQAGMVVTVEPGVYFSGCYGIRIEDLAVVTDEGHRRLTTLGTEPILPGVSGSP